MNTIASLAEEWLRIDQDPVTRLELESLLKQGDEAELHKRLVGRIAFGTAGLRAPMGAGFTRMNAVTVIQASQGLAAYVLENDAKASTRGIVIGHDARFNSLKYAQLAAAAFMAKGIRVLWYPKLVHTPLVPFAVSSLGGAAGVMITASHNPPQDNGYKVYWANGCQIIPPHDIGISAAIQRNLEPLTWDFEAAFQALSVIDTAVEEAYYVRCLGLVRTKVQLPSFVYTAMHGVGLPFVKEVVGRIPAPPEVNASEAGIMHVVAEQAEPDPNFSTVKYPNPEEKGALHLALQHAAVVGCKLIIANDPDADRLAIAEYISSPHTVGTWHQFTGNEVGILLASYALELYQSTYQAGSLAMLCSTVSSGMLKAMAKVEGFHFVETLTGFKWLGNVAQQLTNEGYKVPFAFEEALGYMFTDVVWDKDGVCSAAAFLAAVAGWAKQSMTPMQKLQQLYQRYGYFADADTYLISSNPEITDLVFKAIRARGTDSSRPYPESLGLEKIVQWRDLTVGFDSATKDNKPELPVDSTAQMITCELENGVRFTVRGSGTEPKIKLYVEGRGTTFEEAQSKASVAQQALISDWFSPTRYGLKQPV